MPQDDDRYACQARFAPLGGAAAQRRLAASRAVVVGVGATGSAIAEQLVRAGVGHVRLVDRDVVELSNLHRQTLYAEADAREELPKAEAARRRLAAVSSDVAVEACVADLDAHNARALLAGADAVLDGTDNFATRFLLNDACAALGVPWVYAGVVGATVHGFPVVPGVTACFRCYLPAPPPPGAVETCESAGVLGPAVLVAAGLAATEGLKLLAGRREAVVPGLAVVDVWRREARVVAVPRDPDCPTCAGRYELLERPGEPAVLCGQDAVALRPPDAQRPDLPALAARLRALGAVAAPNPYLLRFAPRGEVVALTLFADGRAIVKGTRDPAHARTVYARFVGG